MKRLSLFLILFTCVCSLSAQVKLDSIIHDYEAYEKYVADYNGEGWPIYNDEIINYQKESLETINQQLSNVKTEGLDETTLINKEMLQFIIEDKLYHLNYGTHLMPLNSEGGFIIGMIYNAQGRRLNSKEAEDKWIEKVNDVPRYLDQQMALLKKGAAEQKLRPKLVVRNCLKVIEDILSKSGEDFFLFVPLPKERLSEVDEEKIYSAFKKLHKFLSSEYIMLARESIGIRENADGPAFYEQRVKYYTTLDMTPQEVYDIGLSEVARIKSEMQAVVDELGFDGTLKEFIQHLRTDESFYPKTEKEILYYAAWLSKKAEEILPRYFTKLPRLPFTVNPVPASIAPNYTTGRYSGGSMSAQRSGQYWVNTYNLPARPLYVLPALTLHEAVPGHHLQGSLAREMKGLPKFRSYYLSAYGEGWGLYSEFLGKEAGIYETLYEEFGRMTYEMWRACRLVVDPGMHYFGMTRQEAVDFMAENTSLSMHEVNTEINRYIGWPGQAVSYKIGELKIRDLRKQTEKALGDNFDIRTFHDMLLENGSIPLRTLERITNNFIKKSKENVEKNSNGYGWWGPRSLHRKCAPDGCCDRWTN